MFNWRQNDSTQSHLIGGEYRILAVIFLEHLVSIAWKYRQSLHSRTCSTTPSLLPSRLCSHASVFDLVWFGLSCFRTQLSVLLYVFSLIQSTCTDLEKWECLGNYIMNIMRPIFNIINHTYLFCSFVLFFVFFIFVLFDQVSLVLVFMVGVIVYKLLVYRPLASNPSTRARAQQIANITGAFVNLTIIMILSRVGTVYHILLVTVFISLKSISNGG